MKAYKTGRYLLIAALGFGLFALGLALLMLRPEAVGVQRTLPYLCVGVGAGILGSSLGSAIRTRSLRNDPQAARRAAIEQKDERNLAIRNRAKARTYDLMVYAYAAILLAFTLVQVEMYVLLTLVALYLFFIFANVYYLTKYHKEM